MGNKRRVSFAEKAHVRLFEKDDSQKTPSSPPLPDLPSTPQSPFNYKMPDISSVHGDVYNMPNLANFELKENDGFFEQDESFEVNVKQGSPMHTPPPPVSRQQQQQHTFDSPMLEQRKSPNLSRRKSPISASPKSTKSPHPIPQSPLSSKSPLQKASLQSPLSSKSPLQKTSLQSPLSRRSPITKPAIRASPRKSLSRMSLGRFSIGGGGGSKRDSYAPFFQNALIPQMKYPNLTFQQDDDDNATFWGDASMDMSEGIDQPSGIEDIIVDQGVNIVQSNNIITGVGKADESLDLSVDMENETQTISKFFVPGVIAPAATGQQPAFAINFDNEDTQTISKFFVNVNNNNNKNNNNVTDLPSLLAIPAPEINFDDDTADKLYPEVENLDASFDEIMDVEETQQVSNMQTQQVSNQASIAETVNTQKIMDFENVTMNMELANDVDLMEEHLSVVDESFAEDDNDEAKTLTLPEFLNELGTQFTEFPEIEVERKVADRLCDENTPAPDFIKTALINVPLLNNLTQTCTEVIDRIAESKDRYTSNVSEFARDPHIILSEYEDATPSEKQVMKEKYQLLKRYAELESLRSWYEYRSFVLQEVGEALERGAEMMKMDLQVLEEFEGRVEGIRERRREKEEELKRRLKEKMERREQRHVVKSKKLEEKKRRVEELEAQVKKLSESKLSKDSENERRRNERIELGTEKKQLEMKILEQRRLQVEHAVTEPATTKKIKSDLALMIHLHKWVPTRILHTSLTMVYDNMFRVTFEDDLSIRNAMKPYTYKIEVLDQNKKGYGNEFGNEHGYNCLEIFGQENVVQWLTKSGKVDGENGIPRVINRISETWECLKDILRDIDDTRMICPVNILDGSIGKIGVQCKFFDVNTMTRIVFFVWIDQDVVEKYESGKLEWSFKCVMGNVGKGIVEKILDDTTKGIGYLSRVCRQLNRLS